MNIDFWIKLTGILAIISFVLRYYFSRPVEYFHAARAQEKKVATCGLLLAVFSLMFLCFVVSKAFG